jgi:hypothetical protein
VIHLLQDRLTIGIDGIFLADNSPRNRYREIRRLKVSDEVASAAIFSPKGPWRLSSASAMHRAFSNKRFKRHGLFSMETLVGA